MLTDAQIIARLVSDGSHGSRGRIIITPMISPVEQIGPSSVDVHLGTDFLVVERSDRAYFDPLMSKPEYEEWLRVVRVTNRYSVSDPFILHPGEFALASTLEFIGIPRDIVGHIDGRSSWARQGLKVHSTAGDIHPGSRGFVVFELENAGPVPILLYPGLAIAQLTFDKLQGFLMEDYSDRGSYKSFSDTLWSAYLDDSVIRAMRNFRNRNGVRTLSSISPTDDYARHTIGFMPIRSSETQTDLSGNLSVDGIRDPAVLSTVLSAIDVFRKEDLLLVVKPIMAIARQASFDPIRSSENELREVLKDVSRKLSINDPEGLVAVSEFFGAIGRKRLRDH